MTIDNPKSIEFHAKAANLLITPQKKQAAIHNGNKIKVY